MARVLTLGNVTIDVPFFQAGLAGYSDTAMRRVARRHGCPLCVTEAMLDHILLADGRAVRDAQLHDEDHPIAGQIMGSEPDAMAGAAVRLVELGYDVVDLNFACPVKKVRKKARGGHLLTQSEVAVSILEEVRQRVGNAVPLTVKLRRSFNETLEMREHFDRIFGALLDLGYAGATVHSRTVEQKYIGPGRWEELAEIPGRFGLADRKDFVLGGSGDVWQPSDVPAMIEQTGVQWVSVARGCIGNPWFFTQTRALIEGRNPLAPTLEEQREVLLMHFTLSAELHGEARASRMMRKFGIKFSTLHPDGESVKNHFIACKTAADWHGVIERCYAPAALTTVAATGY